MASSVTTVQHLATASTSRSRSITITFASTGKQTCRNPYCCFDRQPASSTNGNNLLYIALYHIFSIMSQQKIGLHEEGAPGSFWPFGNRTNFRLFRWAGKLLPHVEPCGSDFSSQLHSFIRKVANLAVLLFPIFLLDHIGGREDVLLTFSLTKPDPGNAVSRWVFRPRSATVSSTLKWFARVGIDLLWNDWCSFVVTFFTLQFGSLLYVGHLLQPITYLPIVYCFLFFVQHVSWIPFSPLLPFPSSQYCTFLTYRAY